MDCWKNDNKTRHISDGSFIKMGQAESPHHPAVKLYLADTNSNKKKGWESHLTLSLFLYIRGQLISLHILGDDYAIGIEQVVLEPPIQAVLLEQG